jgi:hypothetical protein
MHLQAASKTKARGSFVLQETPEAIYTLYPGIMRKVSYLVLTGPRGDRINYVMMSKVTELGVYLTAFGIHDSR